MIDIKFLIRAKERLRNAAINNFNKISFKWKEDGFNIICPLAYTTFVLPLYINNLEKNKNNLNNILISKLLLILNKSYREISD